MACDHYHRWAEDVATMAALGLRAYRFSIAWPRIFPTGGGAPNLRGVDFYRRLLAALREHDIQPMVTLYHWDLPQALQERGGWVNRDTALRFADYAAYLFEQFGADVPLWATLNEPMIAAVAGHVTGRHAPGQRRFWHFLTVVHHLLLAHGLAVRVFRQAHPTPAPPGQAGPGIGIVLHRPNHPPRPSP
jgi:beta-glucosidase